MDEGEVRAELRKEPLSPDARTFAPEAPPPAEDGLERLPIYFDARRGPVGLAAGLGGWEAVELSAEGGSEPIGLVVPPEQPPDLDSEARSLLEGYLRYFLSRDALLAASQWELANGRPGTVRAAVLEDLHSIGSSVLARGAVRAKLRGGDGRRLTAADVERGIRATDQDWLDRPTWGSRL